MTFEQQAPLPRFHATPREEDVQGAQAVLDAILELQRPNVPICRREDAAEARGILAAWAADVRDAGYLEGAMRGRKDTARLVRDALEGEGL